MPLFDKKIDLLFVHKVYLYIFLLFNLFAFTQNKKCDSLLQLIKISINDTNTVNLLNILSDQLKNVKKFDSSLVVADNAIVIAKKINFVKGLACAFNRKGNTYNNISQFANGLASYQKELEYRKILGEERYIANANNGIGNSYCAMDNFSEALKYYLIALEIRKKLNLKNEIGRSYNAIGNVYGGKRNYEKALQYYLLAYNIHLTTNDSLSLGNACNALGNIYNATNNYNLAKFYYQKSLSIRIKLNDKEGIGMAYNHIGNSYLGLKNYKDALTYYSLANQYALQTNYLPNLCTSFGNLGGVYFLMGNYNESIKNLEKALMYATKMNNNGLIMNQCKQLKENYEKLKDYEKAFFFADKYLEAYKKDNNEENAINLTKVEMNYEFQLKQTEILTNTAVEREKQQSKIQLRNNIIVSIIIGLILVLILSYFVFKNYANQKQIELEKKLQQSEEQERARLAQDLHDDLGGTLSALKLNVTSKNSNEQSTVSILNKAITDLRSISHKLMPIDFEHNGINKSLKHYVDNLNASNLQFNYLFDGDDAVIKKDKQLLIYRIILELTHNVIKHSEAKTCTIQGVVFKNKIN